MTRLKFLRSVNGLHVVETAVLAPLEVVVVSAVGAHSVLETVSEAHDAPLTDKVSRVSRGRGLPNRIPYCARMGYHLLKEGVVPHASISSGKSTAKDTSR